MKKFYNLLLGFTAIVAMATVIGCQGPPGIAGDDGTNGIDGENGANGANGNGTCLQCHNESTSLKAKQVQFNISAHALGTRYSTTGECSGCHSTEGFLARKDFSSINEIYDLALEEQTPIACRTCHNVHYTFTDEDWALSLTDEVSETLFGTVSANESTSLGDLGSSNLCVQCHQARDRETVPTIDATEDVTTGSTHWGPHYGVQGNVLNGTAGINVGTGYSSNYHTIENACISCHMYKGNHNLEVNVDACSACHTADVAESHITELQEVIHTKLFELGALLAAKGAMTETIEDGVITGYSPANTTISADEAKALWNYMVVYQDHSYGVHNPKYIKKLLDNSIALVK